MSRSRCPEDARGRIDWLAERLQQPATNVLSRSAIQLLKQFEVLPVERRSIVWPGRGTLMEAWRFCEEAALKDATTAAFDRYRRIKRCLKAQSLPPSPRAIRLAQEHVGGRRLTSRILRKLLGRACDSTALRSAGIPAVARVAPAKVGQASLKELVALFPENCRDRLRAPFEDDVNVDRLAPKECHIRRVLALSGVRCRLLAASALMSACAKAKSMATINLYLSTIERLDRLVPSSAQGHAAAVTDALDALAVSDQRRPVLWAFYQLDGIVASAEDHLRVSLGEEAALVIDALPARHLHTAKFRARMWRLYQPNADRGLRARADRVKAIEPALDSLMIAADNRVAQSESILIFVQRWRRMRHHTGNTPEIVECPGPVVRPDGSLGAGEQIVRFAVRRECELIAEARLVDPSDKIIEAYDKCRGVRPDLGEREHLTYLETTPSVPGGECFEPFFVEAIRVGLLDDGIGLTHPQEALRCERLAASGLPLVVDPADGLLHHDKSTRKLLMALRRAMGQRAPVIVPIVNLVHGLSIARIVLGMSVRGGARIGETKQLRLGGFRTERRGGRIVRLASLRPKNSDVDVDYEIHPAVWEQIRRVKDMAHGRWFRDEFEGDRPSLPVVPLRDSVRAVRSSGRYILVGPTGVLSTDKLGVLVRFLLLDLANVPSHDGRYLFATRLGLAGATTSEIGREIKHSPGSYVTRDYDLSDEILRSKAGAHDPEPPQIGQDAAA